MGKHKHKGKIQQAQHDAQQRAQDASFVNAGGNPEQETDDGAEREKVTQYKEGESMGLRERLKRSSITDWLLSIFTAALAVCAIYTIVVIGGQLDVMRKDQRPWVKIDFTLNNLAVGQPIIATLRMVNNGKTPARVVHGDMAIELVKNGESARINYPTPHAVFTTGLLFPNDPTDTPIVMVRRSPSGTPENQLLMQSELEDFQHLRIFFVVYATVYYKDFFGVDHWTRRCAAETPVNVPGTFTGQNCTDYGDIDTN